MVYAALTETYLETTTTLRNAYTQISDKIPDIEDFIYKDDKITLPERIKGYWNEAKKFLKNPQINSKEIGLKLLAAYDRILTNEMANVKAGVKKVKKPIKLDDNAIEIVEIIHSDGCSCEQCEVLEGFYLKDDNPDEPPFHPGC